MSFYQLDLTGAPNAVRAAFRELVHIDTEVGSDVIIVAATERVLMEKARVVQLKSATQDIDFDFVTAIEAIPPNTIINKVTVREHFAALAAPAGQEGSEDSLYVGD